MADPIQTNVQSQDIPEYLRDYRSALLNAAFSSAFTEPYLRQQFTQGRFEQLFGGATPSATNQPPSGGGGTTPDNTRAEAESQEKQGIAATLRSPGSRLPNLLGMVYDPKTRTYIPEAYREVVTRGMAKGGMVEDSVIEKILKEYQELRENMPVGLTADDKNTSTGFVTAPGSTNPFNVTRGPSATSAYTTDTFFDPDLERFNRPPDITRGPTVNIGTDVTAPPASYTPPSYTQPSYTPPPRGGRTSGGGGTAIPGTGGIVGGGAGVGAGGSQDYRIPVGSTAPLASIYSPGAAGTTQTPAGYNPNQYATDTQARGLASLLGGSVSSTNVGGPVSPPPQNLIELGGSDAFNAGLVQQQLRPGQTPSEMTASLNMLRADVARSGGNVSAIDRMIEQNNQAYASGLSVSPVNQPAASSTPPPVRTTGRGQQNVGPGPNIDRPSASASTQEIVGPLPVVTPPAAATRGEMAQQRGERGGVSSLLKNVGQSADDDGVPKWLRDLEEKPAVPYYGKGFAGGGSLAQFDIGDDGKVKNYRKGGAIRKQLGGGFAPGAKPSTEKSPDVFKAMGGFNKSANVPAIGAGFSGPNIGGVGAASTPSMGGFQNLFAAANPNLASNSGIANIFNPPPVYGQQRIMQFGTTGNPLEFGQYAPGVGFKASDMTLDALRGAGNLPSVFTPEGQISAGTDFGKGVRNINYATDIAGDAATAGREFLERTMRSQDQDSYLMSLMPGIKEMGFKGPIKIDPLTAPKIGDPTGVTAAKLEDFQLDKPVGVSGESIDILGRLGGVNAAQVQGVPQVQQLQMGPAERVAADRTRVEAFGQPQAQQYMSPYMDAVVEAQKREAARQAAMQKAGRSASAVRAGAFGGSRQAIQEGMAEEALQRQIGDIEAVGRQKAFESAQSQFERDRAASLASQQANVQSALQAALANQQAGVTTGRENLGASLATQQLGTQTALQAALANQQARQQAGLTEYGTTADILRGQSAQNLQAALANQQAGLTAGRENLAARLGTQQLAAQQALQAQLANQQAGLTAQQGNVQSALATQQLATQAGLEAAKASQSGDLSTWQMQLDAIKQASAEQEAARQRGFQNRLAAMQQTQAGAAGLAGLGSTMMNIPGVAQQLELQRLAAMQQAGGAVDARTQQAMDLAYQDFINQQNFPYQQMNFLQGILGGVPTGMQVEGVQFQRPAGGGLSGLISAGGGLLMNQLNK